MALASHIEIHEIENNCFLVQHKFNNKHVKMGRREAEFLQFLTAAMGDQGDEGRAYGGELSGEEQRYLTDKFKEWGFLSSDPGAEEQAARSGGWRFNWKSGDLTTIKFLTVNPDRWLNRMLPLIRMLLHPASLAGYALLILAAVGLLVRDADLPAVVQTSGLGLWSYAAIYGMLLLTTAVHELAHGMVCKYYGGRVQQMGAMLFYFNLAMFCDVSDTYRFKRKRHKLAVLFAGIFSQWVMSAIGMLTYYALQGFGIDAPLLIYYGIANLGLSFVNMLPLVKLDGYWMLSHGLGIANMRTKAFRAFFQLLGFRGKPGANAPHAAGPASRRERGILLAYGIAAILFTPCFWVWGLYNVQLRLYDWIGAASLLITAGIAALLLYHLKKFMSTMRQPA
ncbi:daptide biosynthesis intramembrane metalloprotease [Paenibacillus xanthanilyticus]|uniref:Daptide biosynthesis intramembrane metalloprotease n=1 Tax=Paenibacillus xanthanilyticus TaxID=1783531 RepID=A0ABV8JZQ6_9BACL